MYNKKDIEKNLVEFNYFIDDVTLANFIKNWKIDPIYEDEDGVEFYDNMAISKLKKGISLKSQGYTNDQIIYHINKLLPEKLEVEKQQQQIQEQRQEQQKQELIKREFPTATINQAVGSELKNVTIDVTHQTLQMLADTIVEKITNQISEKISIPESALKEDNKELSRKVEELTEDNKVLAKKIEELEQNKCKHLINFEYIARFFR